MVLTQAQLPPPQIQLPPPQVQLPPPIQLKPQAAAVFGKCAFEACVAEGLLAIHLVSCFEYN